MLLISPWTSALVKPNLLFFKCNKLINHFSRPPYLWRRPRSPIIRSFHLTPGSHCVCVSGLPKMMSWGLLLTPTPALVPAATSTRYCTPAWSPPTTTERMVASTDLLTWKRVSLARHQIWRRQTEQTESIESFYSTLIKDILLYSVSGAEIDVTLYSWMMPFCSSEGGGSHETLMDVLLWLPTVETVTCSGGALGARGVKGLKKKKRGNISWNRIVSATHCFKQNKCLSVFYRVQRRICLTHFLNSYS